MKKPHVTVLVSNDLVFDQRVRKTCETLLNEGFFITLVGRQLKNSVPIDRPYSTRRFRLLFTKGALFYAALNCRLFLYLLFTRTDILLANDLDTLAPAYLISKLRGKKLVYDSHEYFTESAGLTNRPFPKWIWERIEGYIFPRLENVYTVNESIAGFYRNKYKVTVRVVRNIPPAMRLPDLKSRLELEIPEEKEIVILQGAFLDVDRGAKEAALAMEYMEGVLLLIIGEGQEMNVVREIATRPPLQNKIKLFGKMPFERLQQYTMQASLGLSLDKDLHLNYKYSLPNKLFDYIRAGVPVLASKLPETERIINEYQIGMFISSHEPKDIADGIRKALSYPNRGEWIANLKKAAADFSWETESQTIKEIFSKFKEDTRIK